MSQYFDETLSSHCDEDENGGELEKKCDCSENCSCGENCDCNSENKCSSSCECDKDKCCCHDENKNGEKCECHHDKNCDCKDDKPCENCGCKSGEVCGDECACEECECEECACEEGTCEKEGDSECSCCEHEHDKSLEYLNLAKQIQADFENFRRHAIEDIKQAKISGQASVIEVFLPCLDTFKEAKKSITDENVLKGVEMIEDSINGALKSLGVEKIDTIGEKYNPHLHNAIAVRKDDSKENDIILDEYQAGYKFNDKVIRYAIVSVNKKED